MPQGDRAGARPAGRRRQAGPRAWACLSAPAGRPRACPIVLWHVCLRLNRETQAQFRPQGGRNSSNTTRSKLGSVLGFCAGREPVKASKNKHVQATRRAPFFMRAWRRGRLQRWPAGVAAQLVATTAVVAVAAAGGRQAPTSRPTRAGLPAGACRPAARLPDRLVAYLSPTFLLPAVLLNRAWVGLARAPFFMRAWRLQPVTATNRTATPA